MIGNGSSLNETPLDLLKGEVTFALNRIHLLYDKTDWRPTYWVMVDLQATDQYDWLDDALINLREGIKCFLVASTAYHVELNRPAYNPWTDRQVTYLKICAEHRSMDVRSEDKPLNWHLPELCKFGTGSAVALQLAVLKGYNPIYVVGMDLNFQRVENAESPDPNHFSEDYGVFDEFAHDPELKNHTHEYAHRMAYEESQRRGKKIYNATIGGGLNAYPRVEFESLFERVPYA